MLHTLSRSPWQCDIDTMLRMVCNGDDLLLLQDGVLAAVNNSCFVEMLKNAFINTFVLREDVEARGLMNQISSKISLVGYVDFVNLVVKHTNQMTW